MSYEKGIVKEVYLLDKDNMIGFIVEFRGKFRKIEVKQDRDNSCIYRGDKVVIVMDVVNGQEILYIELDKGEYDGE